MSRPAQHDGKPARDAGSWTAEDYKFLTKINNRLTRQGTYNDPVRQRTAEAPLTRGYHIEWIPLKAVTAFPPVGWHPRKLRCRVTGHRLLSRRAYRPDDDVLRRTHGTARAAERRPTFRHRCRWCPTRPGHCRASGVSLSCRVASGVRQRHWQNRKRSI